MTPKLKADWIAALRSGKYRQATGVLQDKIGSFCCLGVLADISGEGEWDRHLQYAIHPVGESAIFCEGDLTYAMHIFGIDRDVQKELVRLNDDQKDTFDSIADYIEKAVK